LALAQSGTSVFAAGLTFSGPADQNSQIASTAEPPGCQTPDCTYPVSDALINLVVPPYTFNDPCTALTYAGTYTRSIPSTSSRTSQHSARRRGSRCRC